MFFSEIFVFASFGNSRFLNFGNILVISEPSELVPTRSDPNFREKIAKIRVGTSRKEPFTEITENNKKMTFNSSRLDSRKLVPTRNSTRNFG